MANINPLQLIQLIRSRGPQGTAEYIAQTNFPNNPLIENVLEMGRQGNQQGLEQTAQQLFRQSGRDYATEMNDFINLMKSAR